ncbi:MAG TPA: hypothetical protein VK421_06250 [Pyrinomonadaceae bacterium]|nr:hypothetical protein [Pyrinomonadaceae bacterium]
MKRLLPLLLALALCAPASAGTMYPGYGPCYPEIHDDCPPPCQPGVDCPDDDGGTQSASAGEGELSHAALDLLRAVLALF